MKLYGPFPLELASPRTSAAVALARLQAVVRPGWSPPPAPHPRVPGIYLALEEGEEGQVRLAGWWLTLGMGWLEQGPSGGPDLTPPLVAAILEAAVEAVWWQSLDVTPVHEGVWRPMVVLEWPPALAVRSAVPPPGVPTPAYGDEEASAEGTWLTNTWTVPVQPVSRADAYARERAEEAMLSGPRSLVCVVAAWLSHDARQHEGGWRLVEPKVLLQHDLTTVPLEHWWAAPQRALDDSEPPDSVDGSDPSDSVDESDPSDSVDLSESVDAAGPPDAEGALELPGGSVAFPLAGWLTRSLTEWPLRGTAAEPGRLVPRDVRSRTSLQLRTALFLTLAVAVPTMLLSWGVQLISRPRVQEAAVVEVPSPQPTISVCSPNHARFVEELRCQLDALGKGAPLDDVVCGDAGGIGTREPSPPSSADLQATYCGMLDRSLDGRILTLGKGDGARDVDYASFAAAQACFNVLGHPQPYEFGAGAVRAATTAGTGARVLGDPFAFLEDAALAIRPLVELVGELEQTCDSYRPLLEHRVEGAEFATHVGGIPGTDGATLGETLARAAVATDSPRDANCFVVGANDGLLAAGFDGVCGVADSAAMADESAQIWQALAAREDAPAAGDLVSRYVDARFMGLGPTASTNPVWSCHAVLVSGGRDGSFAGRWDLTIPVPSSYDIRFSAVRSQLALDSALWALRGGASGGTCWNVVNTRLAEYAPVHPLLGTDDPAAPFSLEQQVCGQACAVAYRQRAALNPDAWITPQADLRMCVSTDERAEDEDLTYWGSGQLDRLLLPWNGRTPRDRQPVTFNQVCAFNLVAQGLLLTGETTLLPEEVAPLAWAGETNVGSRIAGGTQGAAVVAAEGLTTYGRSRSRETCANVATQCFVTTLLDVVNVEPAPERYQWLAKWRSAVRSPGKTPDPWCKLIAPYLGQNGLPEGEFDYPCAKGVDEARERVDTFVAESGRGNKR